MISADQIDFCRFLEAVDTTIKENNPRNLLNCVILPEFLKLLRFDKLKEIQKTISLYWNKPYITNSDQIKRLHDEFVHRNLIKIPKDFANLSEFLKKHYPDDLLTQITDSNLMKIQEIRDWIMQEKAFLLELKQVRDKGSRFDMPVREILQAFSPGASNWAFTYGAFVRGRSSQLLEEYLRPAVIRKIATVGTVVEKGDFLLNHNSVSDELNEAARIVQYELMGANLITTSVQYSFVDPLIYWSGFHGEGRSVSLAFAFLSYIYEHPEFRNLAPYVICFGSYQGELVTGVGQIQKKANAAKENGVRVLIVSEPDRKKIRDHDGIQIIGYPSGPIHEVFECITEKTSDLARSLWELYGEDTGRNTVSSVQRIPEGENRLLTAIFADISGFHAVGSAYPMEVLGKCFQVIKEIVEGYEGRMGQSVDTSITAFFGAPNIHENDPERAVLAAMDIRDAINRLGLRVTIGISAGVSYFGHLGSGERQDVTAYGQSVNLARRLQEIGEPGQILIDSNVYDLVRKSFILKELKSLYQGQNTGARLKGIEEPVPVYEAIRFRILPEKLRGIDSLHIPMVGREREFESLKCACDRWLDGQGQMVSIIGEAGIGKSRLVREMKGYLDVRSEEQRAEGREQMAESEERKVMSSHSAPYALSPMLLEGRCITIGQPISYRPFLDILRSYFGMKDEDDNATALSKVKDSISRLFPQNLQDVLPLMANLLSLKGISTESLNSISPERVKDLTLELIRDIFMKLAQEQPLMLILEDLHWSDDLSLDLLAMLLNSLSQTRLMLVCVYRPERDHRAWQLGNVARRRCSDRYTEIILNPLSDSESRQMMDSALKGIQERVKDMILRKSEGNPFFMEESIRSLIDQGLVYHEGDRWKMRGSIGDIQVPDTIQSVVLSRVDLLESSGKYTLQCASVMGRLFKPRLLRRIISRDIDQSLKELEDLELIYIERTTPEPEYAFKHALMHEAVYQSILLKNRQELHGQIAERMEELYREKLEDYYEELAHHWNQSGKQEKALEYLIKAGDKAVAQYSNDAAIGYYTQAIETAEHSDDSHKNLFIIYEKRGDVHRLSNIYEKAVEDYEKALSYSPKRTDRARLYSFIGTLYAWSFVNRELGLQYCKKAVAELDDSEYSLDVGETCSNIAAIASFNLEFELSETMILKAIKIAKELDEKFYLVHHYAFASWMYGFWGRYDKCIEAFSKAKHYLQMPGLKPNNNRYHIAQTYALLGHALGYTPRGLTTLIPDDTYQSERMEFFEKSIFYGEKSGSLMPITLPAWVLGVYYSEKGELDKAQEALLKGWRAGLKTHSMRPCPWGLDTCLNGKKLIDVYMETGKPDRIIDLFDEMADSSIELLSRQEVSPYVVDLWHRDVIEKLVDYLCEASTETAIKIQQLWDTRISQTDDENALCFYHGQRIKYEWDINHLDIAKTYACRSIQLYESPRVKPDVLSPFNKVLIYILAGNSEKASQNAFNCLSSNKDSWNGIGYVIVNMERAFQRIDRPDEFKAICQRLEKEHPEELRKLGITQLYYEPVQNQSEYARLEVDDPFHSLSDTWEWVDPKNDCSCKILGDPDSGRQGVQIVVPPSTDHDLWRNRIGAPRLLREISGDFIIETKIRSGDGGIRSGGILVWKDKDNYMRVCLSSGVYWNNTVGFSGTVSGEEIHSGVHPYDMNEAWLRIERVGDRFTSYVSEGGTTWYRCGWVDIKLEDPIKVGVYALCPQAPTTSTVFEYFRIYRP